MPTAKGIRVNDTLNRLRSKYGSKLIERASDVSPETRIFELHGKGTREIQFSVNAQDQDLPDRHRAAARGRLLRPRPRGLRLDAEPTRARGRRARAAACTRSCSCSTWRLSCCSERRRWPRTVRAARLLGDPAPEPRARDAVLEPQLDARGAAALADPPAAALVDPGHRGPGEVARRLELDDLDQAADLGRADAQQHPVAGAAPVACSPSTDQRVTPDMKCR